MGYREFLIDMLKPMGVYNLSNGYGEAELTAAGKAMDGAFEAASLLEKESQPVSAECYGLENWETLFPILSFALEKAQRRAALSALISTDDTSCTKTALEAQLEACGIPGEISLTDKRFVIKVHFTSGRGEPEPEIIGRATEILPAHIEAEFTRDGVIWDRIEVLFPTWSDLDTSGYNAYELMKLE